MSCRKCICQYIIKTNFCKLENRGGFDSDENDSLHAYLCRCVGGAVVSMFFHNRRTYRQAVYRTLRLNFDEGILKLHKILLSISLTMTNSLISKLSKTCSLTIGHRCTFQIHLGYWPLLSSRALRGSKPQASGIYSLLE
jgi:hypothetical protein